MQETQLSFKWSTPRGNWRRGFSPPPSWVLGAEGGSKRAIFNWSLVARFVATPQLTSVWWVRLGEKLRENVLHFNGCEEFKERNRPDILK